MLDFISVVTDDTSTDVNDGVMLDLGSLDVVLPQEDALTGMLDADEFTEMLDERATEE